MMLTPIDYGMDPNTITKSCLVGAYSEAPPSLCHDPDKYIFWDEYHVRLEFYHIRTIVDSSVFVSQLGYPIAIWEL